MLDILEKLPKPGFFSQDTELVKKIMAKYGFSQMVKHHYFVMQPVQGVGITLSKS